ncbi:MAG TPA: hypothetical protein VF316_11840 [Polyangiaceae bacterium]
MRTALFFALFGFVATAVACSGRGDVYEPCNVSGSVADCVDGTICAKSDVNGSTMCQFLCQDQSNCPAGTACKGVDGASVKSCRPQK